MATISNPQCCLTWPLFISWNVPKDATRRFSSSVNQQHCSFDGFEPGQQDWFCVSFILRNNLLLQSGFKYPVAQSHSPLLVLQYPLPLQFIGHSLTENKSQIFTKVPTRAFNLYQCKVFFANEFLFSIKCFRKGKTVSIIVQTKLSVVRVVVAVIFDCKQKKRKLNSKICDSSFSEYFIICHPWPLAR